MSDTHSQETTSTEAQTDYVKTGELAKRLGLSPATVRNYRARGILPYFQIVPNSYLFPLGECLSIIEATRSPQPAAND